VLIGGTNGKGSVAAMVASSLVAAGYSTMQSPSPHLHSYRERIMVDGQPIGRADLDAVLEEVLDAAEPNEPEHGPATEFELMTAAAYLWAARQDIDVVVMEVGLGGRMDASNTWHAQVAAITNVGLDHREYLGHTLESVATEKAAIIKPRSLAVTGAHGAALDVIRARTDELEVPLTVTQPLAVECMDTEGLLLRHPHLGHVRLPLLGRHQASNAGVAIGIIAALAASGVAEVGDDAIRSGMSATHWPARLELLMVEDVQVLLDGAHNPDGAAVLAAAIDELAPMLPVGRPTLLAGIMADKEVLPMLHALARSEFLRRARFVACGVPESDRAMPATELASAWIQVSGPGDVSDLDDADAALAHALQLAASENGLLVVAGSLYLVGHVRSRLRPEEVPA
jgi:dihydrofolate synthase/folylpolyglutamate synthase